jgi:hypothetical protein
MNARQTILLAALFATAAPTVAGDNVIKMLAQQSGLNERKVAMVLGNRSAYAEYRTSYHRARKQLERSIGRDAVERLANGEEVVLSPAGQGPAIAASRHER